MTYEFKITGMTCDHCKSKVTEALKGVPGTLSVVVDLEDGFAEVDAGEAEPGDYVAAVAAAGYQAQLDG